MRLIRCSTCKLNKNSRNFSVDRTRSSGYRSSCRPCIKVYNRTYRNKHKERLLKYSNDYHYKNKGKVFGLSNDEYQTLITNQNNKCAICNKNEMIKGNKGQIRNLAIDHCHKTGKVRGLLCYACNVTLGLLKEDLKTIQQMYFYLIKNKVLECQSSLS